MDGFNKLRAEVKPEGQSEVAERRAARPKTPMPPPGGPSRSSVESHETLTQLRLLALKTKAAARRSRLIPATTSTGSLTPLLTDCQSA